MSTVVEGKGLEGIVAANSGICWIDGKAGILSYRGIDIHDLAEYSTFEETTYLLWNGVLPNELALREFQAQLSLARGLDFRIVDMLRGIPASASPMEVLRTAVSALSFYDADEKDNSHEANVRKCFHLTAQMATDIHDWPASSGWLSIMSGFREGAQTPEPRLWATRAERQLAPGHGGVLFRLSLGQDGRCRKRNTESSAARIDCTSSASRPCSMSKKPSDRLTDGRY
jgi:hypothetical protein